MGEAPNWFLRLLQIPLCNQDSLWCAKRGKSLYQINRTTGAWWDGSPNEPGISTPGNKEMKTLSPNPGQGPRNVAEYSSREMGHQGLSRSNIY
jgi:hypothetical protein